MPVVDYTRSTHPVRPGLVAMHAALVDHVAASGTWWTGAERIAIAASVRAARSCALCSERKAALSPNSVSGAHDDPGALAPTVVDTIHRIVTDPGRLSKSFYDGLVASDALSPERYVELAAIVAFTNALEVFARALGVDPIAWPEGADDAPSRARPATARVDGAWVPQIPAGGEDWRALFGDLPAVAEIGRALSLVPDEVRMLQRIGTEHYMSLEHVPDPRYSEPDRGLDRLQMELVAARVSALNECFY